MLWAASAPLIAQNGARRLTVREVEIEGNRAIDDFALRASIETTASAWLARFPVTRWVGWGRRPASTKPSFDATFSTYSCCIGRRGEDGTLLARLPEVLLRNHLATSCYHSPRSITLDRPGESLEEGESVWKGTGIIGVVVRGVLE